MNLLDFEESVLFVTLKRESTVDGGIRKRETKGVDVNVKEEVLMI